MARTYRSRMTGADLAMRGLIVAVAIGGNAVRLETQQPDTSSLVAVRDTLLALKREINIAGAESRSLAVRAETLATVVEATARPSAIVRGQVDDIQDDIDRKKAESVDLAAKLLLQQAQGALQIRVTVGAYRFGLAHGLTASPFFSPTFDTTFSRFQQWQWVPALAGFAGSLLAKTADTKAIWAGSGLLVTASLSDLIGFFAGRAKSDVERKNLAQLQRTYESFDAIMDLFTFNREVYLDARRVEQRLVDVISEDSLLHAQMETFRSNNDALIREPDYRRKVQMAGFDTYIDSARVYFDRFQRLLTAVDESWRELGSTVQAYQKSELYQKAARLAPAQNGVDATSAEKIAGDTKRQVDSLLARYHRFTADWRVLARTYYTISPADAQQLNEFYVLKHLEERFKGRGLE